MGDPSKASPQDQWMAHPSIGVQVDQLGTGTGGGSLIHDPVFQRLVEAMEADADEADKEWKANLGNPVFQYLDASVLAEYKTVGAECETARGNFTAEWNRLVFGGGNAKKLLAVYDMFSLRMGMLQRANERVEALVAIDFAKLLEPFLQFLMRLKKIQLAIELQRKLKRLQADLEEAETAVTKAEVKTALNIAISVVTTVVAPEATLAKLALAGGGMVAHIALDHGLGGSTTTGTVVFIAGDSGDFIELTHKGKEAIEKIKGGSKSIGVAAAAVTAVLDIHEVYEGKEKVEKVEKELEEVQKELEKLLSGALPLLADFIALDRMIKVAPAVVNKALAAGDDAAKNYDAMKREIEKAISEGL